MTEQSSYWRNVISVSAGTIGAQSIAVVGYVIIAKVYDAAAFGLYASWLSVATIIAVISTGSLETSLVLDEDGAPRQRSTGFTLTTCLLGSIALGVGLLPLHLIFPSLLGDLGLFAAVLIPVGAFLFGSVTTFQAWSSASGRFTELNRARLLQALLTTVLPAIFGAIRPVPQSIMLGFTIGLAVTFLYWTSVFGASHLFDLSATALKEYWGLRRRYLLLVLPAVGISAITFQLPILVLKTRFGPELAGIFALTVRVLATPISLVGIAIRDVFKRHASVAYRDRGECRAEYLNSLYVLSGISALFAVVMFLTSRIFFETVFGDEWSYAGEVALWLLPLFALGIVASPLSYLVYIAQREHYDFVWQLALFCVVLSSLTIGATFRSAITMYSVGYSVMYVIYLLLSYRLSLGVDAERSQTHLTKPMNQ